MKTFTLLQKSTVNIFGSNYAKTYPFGFVPLRIAHVYGYWPGDMGRGIVVSQMVRACVMQEGLDVNEQVAEWAHYIDLGAFNAGSGKIHSLNDIVTALKRYFKSVRIKVSSEAKTSRSTPLDMSKAKEMLGFTPKYDLDRAVRELIEVWKKNLGKI